MLPAWATVVLTLGAAALAALAGIGGALGGTLLRGRLEREAEWRARMTTAAEAYFRGLQSAVQKTRDAARYSIDTPAFRGSIPDYSAERERALLKEAVQAADALQAELAAVELFFDPQSSFAATAEETLLIERAALEALRKGDPTAFAVALSGLAIQNRALHEALPSALKAVRL